MSDFYHFASDPMTDTFEGRSESLNSLEADRFSQALTMAMVKNQFSQRKLCEAMDITMGTMTKYFKGKIAPDKVNVMIMHRLAKALGITTDSLLAFIQTGEYESDLTIDDVAAWIRTHGQEDLPRILQAVSESANAPKTVRTEWNGYSDEEAEEFCHGIHDSLSKLVKETGTGVREIWKKLEAELLARGVVEQEVEVLHDIAMGFTMLTGEQYTAARKNFLGRFPVECPLVMSLQGYEALKAFEPLNRAGALCMLPAGV